MYLLVGMWSFLVDANLGGLGGPTGGLGGPATGLVDPAGGKFPLPRLAPPPPPPLPLPRYMLQQLRFFVYVRSIYQERFTMFTAKLLLDENHVINYSDSRKFLVIAV
ncbi:unnamed protein product [Fusarium graminearum]|nr:unnamed protein product [Fusarium graminearum]